MNNNALSQALIASCLLIFSIAGLADDAPDQRVLITDPDVLAQFGYAPDAQHVYATRQVWEELTGAADEVGTEQVEPASPRGTITQVNSIHATDFLPVRVTGTTSYGSTGNEERWCDAGLSNVYLGMFRNIPDGATLRFRRIWFFDDSSENISASLIRICVPFDGPGASETTILASNTSSGTPGYGRFGPGSFLDELVDGQSCMYGIRVNLGDSSSCAGNQLRIMKASLSLDVPGNTVFADRFEELP